MLFKKNKKAMSPLLVTIFLAALAVSLGAMVVSWGSSFQDGESASCGKVEIAIQVAEGREMICIDEQTGSIKLMIVNSGDAALKKILHRQIGSDFEVEDRALPNSNLASGQVLNTQILLTPGRPRMELVPVIEVLNEEIMCSNKAIIRETISLCE